MKGKVGILGRAAGAVTLMCLLTGPLIAASFESRTLAVEAPVLKSFLQDLNLDGLLDFAFHAEDRRFVLFFQEEDGEFRRAEAKFVMPEGTDSLDLADTDGDEVPDICLTVDGHHLLVIASAGNRDFWADQVSAGEIDSSAALDLDISAGGPSSMVAVPLTDSLHRSPDLMWDLDGDGRQDLIYPRFDGLDIWFNPDGGDSAGSAPFAAARRQFIPRGPQVALRGSRIVVRREMPLALDIFHDGRNEVVFDPRPLHGLGQLECGWCRYVHGQADLQWSAQELQFAVGESVTEYLLDDFNGDGEPDLAVLSTSFNMDDPGGGDGTVSSGGGSFFEEKKLRVWLTSGPGGTMGRLPAGEWTSEINIWQDALISFRDLTGDGKGDLCLFYYKGLIKAKLVIDIHPGLGNGTFGERVKGLKLSFDSADRGAIFLDSDMDGDGLKDMVLLAEEKVRIHRRNPAGGKEPYSRKPWAVLEQRPETGEKDEDGETVTLSLGSNGTDIAFSSNQLDGLRIADLNSDGHQDLVLVSRPNRWNEEDEGRPPVTLLIHLALDR